MEIRTLRITVNGAPAVLPVSGFSRPGPDTVVYLHDGTFQRVRETPEELAALWDAAAPSPPEQEPDEWQAEVTHSNLRPCKPPGNGREPTGPWKPINMVASDEWHAVLWRRPLRRVAE
jgi:hypothetical protein